MKGSFCQTVSPLTADFGVGPDLIHLETTVTVFRPVEFYHIPWPVVWVVVFDEFGAIHDTLWTMPTPTEFDVPLNQFPLKLPTNNFSLKRTVSLRIY